MPCTFSKSYPPFHLKLSSELDLEIAEMQAFIEANKDIMNTTTLEQVLELMIQIRDEINSTSRVKRSNGKSFN